MAGSRNNLPLRGTKGEAAFSFCSWLLLFLGMSVAELGVLIAALSPGRPLDLFHLGVVSLYAQWINILSLTCLCLSEQYLMRLPRQWGWVAAWLVVALVAAVVAFFVGWFDHALGWGLTDYRLPLSHTVIRTVIITMLLAGAVMRYLAVHRRWQEGIKAEERARFQALQARIHPHFLFNSLNSIAALTAEQPAEAELAIENLSDVLRGSLRDPDHAIPLRDELDLCRRYLAMEALRLGSRLQVVWRIDETPADLLVPPLLLQPLVENAIIHGVQPRLDGGQVTVACQRSGHKVVLEVRSPLATQVANTRQSGIAQANLRGRLDLRYGSRASFITRTTDAEYIAQLILPEHESPDR